MRIIQVNNVRWFNATSWYALNLSRLLQEAGHEVLVLTLEGTHSHRKALDMGLQVQTMDLNTSNPLRLARVFGQLRRLVHDFRPDIVNCHRGESFLLWGHLRFWTGDFALVRTRGDQRLPQASLPNRILHRKVADAVVVTNSAMGRHFRERLSVPDERLHMVLGGVDTHHFRFDAEGRRRIRREYGFADNDFVVGLVGRFDEVKGQRETIQAVAALRRQGLDRFKLMLLGFDSVTSAEQVRSWLNESGLDSHAVITGRREDVPACLSALDGGLVASKWSETIARAALELMACGRPIISTSVGVMPDLVSSHGLVPPGDVQALATALARLAGDDDYRARLGEEQRATLAELTMDKFLERSLGVYRQALRMAGLKPDPA
ncbi:glycosyltransferase family 4 protein [Desulfocurvibacter africanus]|uniref:Glycosyl transferase group 1 n=1 Tax=Desulfocurvibacter africanus subsp. africanus str. Walvis Bay TaxID=690850 RepID=F3YV68_DESAF|nr:glycosyltransferase family 4 protein [Desulfocurvibacter africanus]EGJ48386.1 glycosyl transferase group 1 [Desulfocurvibacter africanus subsp. africanus str. Walvis Bay]